MSATTNLGKVSVTPKGAWANTNTYEILDIVTSGGSSYLAKQDVPVGVSLSNTSYWIMIAEKGDGGEVTSASASISGGYGTPGVSVTAGGTAHERTLAFAFTNLRGEKGETGNGIDSVYKTGTSGLVDTYTILFTDGNTYEFEVNNGTASIDNTLTKSGWAADAKVVGDTKASIDGFYETMGVGVADNLTPYSEDSGATQDIPFIAQGTGCGNGESVVDTGSYLQFKKKLGNTVGVNQLCYNGNFDGTTGWTTSNTSLSASGNIGTFTASAQNGTINSAGQAVVQGHKYLISASIKQTTATDNIYLYSWGSESSRAFSSSTAWQTLIYIITSTQTVSNRSVITIRDSRSSDWDAVQVKDCFCIDLTLWFGSNDRIPSDLLAHPENWGRYYSGSLAYNAGTLGSADGTLLKSISRNVFDGQLEMGYYNDNTGAPQTNTTGHYWRSVNYFEVIPNTAYYSKVAGGYTTSNSNITLHFYDENKTFISSKSNAGNLDTTTPANCRFVRLTHYFVTATQTSPQGITISLYYSGESGYDQYYPFSVLADVDTGSEVLRSGIVADEKTPDGTITRRVEAVNLGTLTWALSNTWFQVTSGLPLAKATAAGERHHLIYGVSATETSFNGATSTTILQYGVSSGGSLRISKAPPYDNMTAAQFQAAMSGVWLVYELATPTTEQGTAFAENIPCDDFGSMYWTQTEGIPQGNEIFYPVDYKASIDTLYNRVEGDMGAIVIDSQLEVVADRIPEAPSSDGTYTLKATVSSGTKTYSWVADE